MWVMYKVAVIVGSLRKDSINRKFAQALAKLAAPKLQLSLAGIDDLPVYNQDFDASMPEGALRLKAELEAADAVLLVTPEHNRSLSTALKNAIDWASRPYGKSSWAGRPVAIVGASAGTIGTAVAQQHLRAILGHLDAAVLGQPEVFFTFKPGLIDDEGNVTDEATRQFLRGFLDRFRAWIGLISGEAERAVAA
jgi:chromate reductase, NAD(P)H dehydrogenase (quinone)